MSLNTTVIAFIVLRQSFRFIIKYFIILTCPQIVRLSCRRKRIKTVGSSDSPENTTTCACSATCAKFCSCCSSACCIACWSCFPCCNLFTCLRSFFCGSQVHPASSGERESKSDFYIGGVLQDKDAEIAYLKNELNQVGVDINVRAWNSLNLNPYISCNVGSTSRLHLLVDNFQLAL